MRVLLITKPLVPPWTDSGKLVPRDLVRASSGRHEFDILVSPGEQEAWPDWVRSHAIYRGGGDYRPSPLQHVRLVSAVLRMRQQIDLLHFFFQPHSMATTTARVLARLCRRPSLHTVLSAPKRCENPGRLLFADRTVTLSRATAEIFQRDGSNRLQVIPPGLAETGTIYGGTGQMARELANLAGRFVIYPGDYEFSGGHDFLLEVWAGRPELPVLVFTGRQKTPRAREIRRRLEARARQTSLANRVRVLGTVDHLPGLIAASAALLFPAESLYGKSDLPLVILEAWREATPVLTSDLAPLAEAVEKAGMVLPLEVDVWGEAIAGLPRLGHALASSGRSRFQSDYTARCSAMRYQAIYDEFEGNLSPLPGSRK